MKDDRVLAFEFALGHSRKPVDDGVVAAFTNKITDWLNSDTGRVRFQSLFKEMMNYATTHRRVPPLNSDEYWDWRCNEAKIELFNKIDDWFYAERTLEDYFNQGSMIYYRGPHGGSRRRNKFIPLIQSAQ